MQEKIPNFDKCLKFFWPFSSICYHIFDTIGRFWPYHIDIDIAVMVKIKYCCGNG